MIRRVSGVYCRREVNIVANRRRTRKQRKKLRAKERSKGRGSLAGAEVGRGEDGEVLRVSEQVVLGPILGEALGLP